MPITFNNEINISIKEIPLPWIPKIELYYPDLPQFPILYINKENHGNRIIACPVSVSFIINDKNCDAVFTILTNVENNKENVELIQSELSERIGFSSKIAKEDIIKCCNGNKEYETLLGDLWKYIKSSYGDYIPYGKYYEEIYSIVRFVSAWQPKTGRQSEMRMLYNFMSAFGDRVQMPHKWEHLEFYVIPNIYDVINDKICDYTNFSILNSAMQKLFHKYFINEVINHGKTFKVMNKAWPQNKDDFIKQISDPMFSSNELSEQEKKYADRLVDAFNRHSWRASYFISAFLNIDKDYYSWSKQFIVDFYNNGKKYKGYSEKVFACFLQQGFLNPEAIPIDIWIKSFYEFPLGIETNNEFFNSFSNLGKLERAIWLSSQSNKTNMINFFDILWCQRYGTNGNKELRGINPIACYECKLKYNCVGASKYSNKKIMLIDHSENTEDKINTIFTLDNSIYYVITLKNKIPEKCFIHKKNPILIDEFSGYILDSKDKIPNDFKDIISFKDLVFQNPSKK